MIPLFLIQVKLTVFWSYIKACTIFLTLLMILFYVLSTGASVGTNFWLAHWSNEEANPNNSARLYVIFCCGAITVYMVMVFLLSIKHMPQ